MLVLFVNNKIWINNLQRVYRAVCSCSGQTDACSLCSGHNYDSTSIRRPFDRLSKSH